MAGHKNRRSKAAKKQQQNSANDANDANLQTPLELPVLNTPASTSSITVSPSDLTPPVAGLETLTLSPPNANPQPARSATMSSFDGPAEYDSSNPTDPAPPDADAPHADLHSKLQEETPRYSRTNVFSSLQRAVHSSKMLNQVLGLQPPEPFMRPPEMPRDLEQRFVASLQEYGLDFKMQGQSPYEMMKTGAGMQKVSVGSALGKAVLENIEEEMESPVKATYMEAAPDGARAGLTINPPVWHSGDQAVAGTGNAFVGEQGMSIHTNEGDRFGHPTALDPANRPSTAPYGDRTSVNDFEGQGQGDASYNPYAGFGSTTTLADSYTSRPGSSATVNDFTAPPPQETTNYAAQDASFPYARYGTGFGAVYYPPLSSGEPVNLTQASSGPVDQQHLNVVYDNAYDGALDPNNFAQRASSVPPVLFPSPRVEQEQSWDFVQNVNRSIAPPGYVPGGFAPAPASNTQLPYPMPFHTQPQNAAAPSIPHIAVQSPSPKKLPTKKRSAGSQHNMGPPPAKTRAADDTAGLPVLSENQEAQWKLKFPGNTNALLTIMLPWSVSMQRLYTQLRNPYLFSINAAFPRPVQPPIHRPLISVAFYDTSVTPHKEVRYIGPGDVASISYNEVDVFDSTVPGDDVAANKVDAMKRALGLTPTPPPTGAGRWAYIVLKGHEVPANSTAPHVIVAWQVSAVTSASDCLHTIYPDAYVASRPAPKSSLQNLAARYAVNLRAASTSELVGGGVAKEGALTLKREVWKMEKAGRIPLIEGFRVDVKRWGGWLDAVGRGEGKVIVWRERE